MGKRNNKLLKFNFFVALFVLAILGLIIWGALFNLTHADSTVVFELGGVKIELFDLFFSLGVITLLLLSLIIRKTLQLKKKKTR